jgi:beta-lactamase superfamily II metal-dependent hydrolase
MYDGPQLLRGTGPADDRNNSGYVLQIPYKDGNRLLTGDVAYNYIPSIAFIDVAGLAVTHHGGMKGVAPPTGAGLAIASYGVPNRYHHPYEAFLQDHAAAGWTIQRTATHGRVPRGDRWL